MYVRKLAGQIITHRAERAAASEYTNAESRGVPDKVAKALARAGMKERVQFALSDPRAWQYGRENIAAPGEPYAEAVTGYRRTVRALAQFAGYGECLERSPAGSLQTSALLGELIAPQPVGMQMQP